MRATLLVLLALLGVSPLYAGWSSGWVTDPESDGDVRAALGTSRDGFVLAIFREAAPDGRAIGLLRMPPGRMDFLAGERPPVLVLDGGTPLEVALLSGELKWSRFVLWSGEGELLTGLLRDVMEGRELVVRYPLHSGGYKETLFELAGARHAIAGVLGVPAEVSEEDRRRAARLEEARSGALESCLDEEKKKRQERCLAQLGACSGSEITSAEELEACLEGDGER